MGRPYLVLVAIIACAILLLDNNMIAAQGQDQPKPPKTSQQKWPSSGEQEPTKGYPVPKRRIGTPIDVEWDLDNSFPKSGSLLELILRGRDRQHQ